MVDKVYCIATVHYVAIGTVGVSVMPAGGIAEGMSDKDFADFMKLNAVRTATIEEVAAFDAIVKKSATNSYPGSRGPSVAAPFVPSPSAQARTDAAATAKAAAIAKGKADEAKKAKAHADSLAVIAATTEADPEATPEVKAAAHAAAEAAAKVAADLAEHVDIVG